MAKKQSAQKVATKKQKIFLLSIVPIAVGLLGITGYLMFFSGEVNTDLLSTVTTDVRDLNDNSIDITDSDTDDDFIIDTESLAAFDIGEDSQEIEANY